MTVRIAPMHTVSLSQAQLEEVFGLVSVAHNKLQDSYRKAKGKDKLLLLMELGMYQAIYSEIQSALKNSSTKTSTN